MDVNFFQDDDELGLKFYENEPIEEVEGEMRLNGLRYQNTQARIERRRHKRFRVNVCAFALIRSENSKPIKIQGRSMGEIACAVFRSKPAKLGRINNISMGGLMFRYVDSQMQSEKSPMLDILLADCRYYLENLRIRSIEDLLLPNAFLGSSVQMRQLQVQFEALASYQIAKLEYFIGENRSPSKRKSAAETLNGKNFNGLGLQVIAASRRG